MTRLLPEAGQSIGAVIEIGIGCQISEHSYILFILYIDVKFLTPTYRIAVDKILAAIAWESGKAMSSGTF